MKQSGSNTLKDRRKDGQIAKATNPTPQLAQGKTTSMPRDKKNGERSSMPYTSFQEQAKDDEKKQMRDKAKNRGGGVKNQSLTDVLAGYQTFRPQLLQPLGSACLAGARIPVGTRGEYRG